MSVSPASARIGLTQRRSASRFQMLEAFQRKVGITSSGLVLLLLCVVGWILARIIGSRAMFFLVYGGVIVFAMSYFLGKRRISVDANRSELPARVREGQIVEVELKLTAKRRVTTVILEEVLHPQLGTTVHVPIPILPGGQEVSHNYSFSPKLRGVYDVGPLVATWSDPFGLTQKRVSLAKPSEIIVHPSTEMVHDRVVSREWEDPPIRPPVSKPWPSGFEFYGMREYVPGDDPRRIVWRASARSWDPDAGTGHLLVRESEQGITDRVTLILDTDSRHHSPGTPSDTFETAIKAVASLGTKHLNDGFAVTLETNEKRVAKELRSRRQAIALLDELARLQPQKNVSLARLIERLVTSPGRNMHNVLVTPHIDEQAGSRLRLLLDRGISMLVAVVLFEDSDPESLHRAGALGTNVVEIWPGQPLEGLFRRVVAGGLRT